MSCFMLYYTIPYYTTLYYTILYSFYPSLFLLSLSPIFCSLTFISFPLCVCLCVFLSLSLSLSLHLSLCLSLCLCVCVYFYCIHRLLPSPFTRPSIPSNLPFSSLPSSLFLLKSFFHTISSYFLTFLTSSSLFLSSKPLPPLLLLFLPFPQLTSPLLL